LIKSTSRSRPNIKIKSNEDIPKTEIWIANLRIAIKFDLSSVVKSLLDWTIALVGTTAKKPRSKNAMKLEYELTANQMP
jgi:hypothetical protein